MEKTVFFFQRVEKKYLITAEQKAALLECIGQSLVPDSYGKSTVCGLYLDTPSWRLIREFTQALIKKSSACEATARQTRKLLCFWRSRKNIRVWAAAVAAPVVAVAADRQDLNKTKKGAGFHHPASFFQEYM